MVAEGVSVNPNVDPGPRLGLAEGVRWVRAGNQDCEQAGDCSESGSVPLGVVEADLLDEELDHHRVDQACDARTRGDDADSEALLFPEPSGDNCYHVSKGVVNANRNHKNAYLGNLSRKSKPCRDQ